MKTLAHNLSTLIEHFLFLVSPWGLPELVILGGCRRPEPRGGSGNSPGRGPPRFAPIFSPVDQV